MQMISLNRVTNYVDSNFRLCDRLHWEQAQLQTPVKHRYSQANPHFMLLVVSHILNLESHTIPTLHDILRCVTIMIIISPLILGTVTPYCTCGI